MKKNSFRCREIRMGEIFRVTDIVYVNEYNGGVKWTLT
jgi:hypothetical protein